MAGFLLMALRFPWLSSCFLFQSEVFGIGSLYPACKLRSSHSSQLPAYTTPSVDTVMQRPVNMIVPAMTHARPNAHVTWNRIGEEDVNMPSTINTTGGGPGTFWGDAGRLISTTESRHLCNRKTPDHLRG